MLKANCCEIQTLHATQENEKYEIYISIKNTLGYLFLTGFDRGGKKKTKLFLDLQNSSGEFLAKHINAVLPTYIFFFL